MRVWDLPTRVFHWSLTFCVFASLGSAWVGGNAMVWHLRFGYAVLGLLIFRLLWGFFGGHWSRFRTFAYAPSASLRYLRGQSRPHEHHHVGHSPLGAFSVFALLAVLAAQAASGLFADDEIATTGPLVKFVTAAASKLFTRWHTSFGQWLIVGLVILHIAAVLFYWLARKNNLIGPMLSGDKHLAVAAPGSVDNLGSRMLAVAIFLASAAFVTWLVDLAD